MTEIEPCPKCGALPCDWTDNPHTAPSGDEVERVACEKYAAFTDGMEAAAQICGSLAETTYDDADSFEAATGCEAAIMAVVRQQRTEQAAIAAMRPASGVFSIGDRVTKIKGSAWTGRVVGTYITTMTPEGYAVESENEPGSVQIYPAAALRQAGEG